jgi:hypothetical protein
VALGYGAEQRLVFALYAVFAAGELAFPDLNRNALRFVLLHDRRSATALGHAADRG